MTDRSYNNQMELSKDSYELQTKGQNDKISQNFQFPDNNECYSSTICIENNNEKLFKERYSETSVNYQNNHITEKSIPCVNFSLPHNSSEKEIFSNTSNQ